MQYATTLRRRLISEKDTCLLSRCFFGELVGYFTPMEGRFLVGDVTLSPSPVNELRLEFGDVLSESPNIGNRLFDTGDATLGSASSFNVDKRLLALTPSVSPAIDKRFFLEGARLSLSFNKEARFLPAGGEALSRSAKDTVTFNDLRL